MIGPERRHIPWVSLGQNEAPLPRGLRSELDRDEALTRQQFGERISAHSLLLRGNTPSQFISVQVTCSVEKMRQLVVGACAPPGSRPSPL